MLAIDTPPTFQRGTRSDPADPPHPGSATVPLLGGSYSLLPVKETKKTEGEEDLDAKTEQQDRKFLSADEHTEILTSCSYLVHYSLLPL